MEQMKNVDTILAKLKSQGAMTSGELAKELVMTSMGARQHLLRLEEKNLVSHFLQKADIGRPKQMWQLTELGHQRFPDRHADLTLQIIESVGDVFGTQGLEQVIVMREKQMLEKYQTALNEYNDLYSKVEALAAIRSQEGYMASAEKVSANEYLLIESHCPICAAASKCQNFCRSELSIFQQCFSDGVSIERSEYLLTGDRRCVYRIRKVNEGATTAS